MKLIKLARRKGKTTRLINKAHNKSIYIVCLNIDRAYEVFESSQRMNKSILFPLTLDELIQDRYKGNRTKEYLIDDIDDITQTLVYRYLLRPLTQNGGKVLEVTASVTNLAKIIGADK